MLSDLVNNSRPRELKIVVLGDAGVGKTSFVERFWSSEEPTTADYAKIYSLNFYTTLGAVNLKVWDANSIRDFEKYEQEFLEKHNHV